MSWLSWLSLAMATVVAAMIVDKLRISNWFMIPVVLVVWLVSVLIILVLKLVFLMLPFLIIGGVIWFLLKKSR